ncbi:hypothetical protein BT69DRAFT_1346196 [Atractiella rhizophila]|nr:hypothetical protein BT69DRAFT_1346196 [Atractiella rhizophila]
MRRKRKAATLENEEEDSAIVGSEIESEGPATKKRKLRAAIEGVTEDEEAADSPEPLDTTCPLCLKTFTRPSDKNRHLRNVHKEETDDNGHAVSLKVLKSLSIMDIEQVIEAYKEDFERSTREEEDDFEDGMVEGVLWTAEEKSMFMNSLRRRGRWRVDAILSDLRGSKSLAQVHAYISLLDQAVLTEGTTVDHPAARELGGNWTALEEQMAAYLVEKYDEPSRSESAYISITSLCDIEPRQSADPTSSHTSQVSSSRPSSPGIPTAPEKYEFLTPQKRRTKVGSFRSRIDDILASHPYSAHSFSLTECKAVYDAILWRRRKSGEKRALRRLDEIVDRILGQREEVGAEEDIEREEEEDTDQLNELQEAAEVFFLGKVAALTDRLLKRTSPEGSFTAEPEIATSIVEVLLQHLRAFISRVIKEVIICSSWSSDTSSYEKKITANAMRSALNNLGLLTSHETMQQLKHAMGMRITRFQLHDRTLIDSEDEESSSLPDGDDEEEEEGSSEISDSTEHAQEVKETASVEEVDSALPFGEVRNIDDCFSWDPPRMTYPSQIERKRTPDELSFGYRSPSPSFWDDEEGNVLTDSDVEQDVDEVKEEREVDERDVKEDEIYEKELFERVVGKKHQNR